MKALRISPSLSLPLEVMTTTIAVLGIRNSGKTNTCVVLTEELLEAGQQVVIIDPTDVWWGLKSSKDGKRAGFPVVVFGGRHGDVPLEAGDGATVADFIVEERLPAILSLRHFESQNDQRKFVTEFARRLYHRKGEEGKDTPMLLVIDEAHLFVPQRVTGAEAQMVGALQKLVRQGRASGIGVAIIDQRAASVNKDVLTQLELLICHRTTSPQDSKALEGWIEQNQDDDDERKEFLRKLPSLERGVAWCWSPGWLKMFELVAIRERRTFDSSATPKAGEIRITPTTLANIDLAALKKRMSQAIEKAKADDPKALRAEIDRMRREFSGVTRGSAKAPPPPEPERIEVEVPVISKDDLTTLESDIEQLSQWSEQLKSTLESVDKTTRSLSEAVNRGWVTHANRQSGVHVPSAKRARAPTRLPAPEPAREEPRAPRAQANGHDRTTTTTTTNELGEGVRKCMIAIAQYQNGCTRAQLTQITGYKRRTRNAYIQRLHQAGHVTIEDGERVMATKQGKNWLGDDYKSLPIGEDLRAYWLRQLPEGEAKILSIACEEYPDAISRQALSTKTGYKLRTRNAYVQRLHARELITEVGRDRVRAVETLFD